MLHHAIDEGITIDEALDNVPSAAAGNVAREETKNPARNGLVSVDDDTITAEVAAGRAARAMGEQRPADGGAHGERRNVVVEVVDAHLVGELAGRAAIIVTIEPVDLDSGVVPLDTVLVHLRVGRLKVDLRLAEEPRAWKEQTADLEASLVAAIDRSAVHNTNVSRDIGVQHITLGLVLGRLVGRGIDGITQALEDLIHGGKRRESGDMRERERDNE